MKYKNQKTNRQHGFTLVELVVVLAITGIIAALTGGGLIAYARMARFEKNEANARTLFQTVQLAAARMEAAGELDTFTQQVADESCNGHIDASQFLSGDTTEDEAKAKAAELNPRVYALYFDKGVAYDGTDTSKNVAAQTTLMQYLQAYTYDASFLNASFCVEIDVRTGQVYSAFYDTNSTALRFANNAADTPQYTQIDDRSYEHRRRDSLVGYYSTQDAVNVVELQQTKLRVRNLRLSNAETLTLNWSGNSKSYDLDTEYTATFYNSKTNAKLFSVLVRRPEDVSNGQAQELLDVTVYNADGSENTEKSGKYTFPLTYNGSFILTLDAMNDAAILRGAELSDGVSDNESQSVRQSSLFSITRFVDEHALDIYAEVTAAPRADSTAAYLTGDTVQSNTENTLFAAGSTDSQAELTYFRHLYNLRWYDETNAAMTAELTKNLDWTSGTPVVYCAGETDANGNVGRPRAKTPTTADPVAWPTLTRLNQYVTLNGLDGQNRQSHTISNLQLRGASVASAARRDGVNYDRYIGLIGENAGKIQNLTLIDPDVLVNATLDTTASENSIETDYGWLNAVTADNKKEENTDYRPEVRAVGALCGVSTGSVQNCTLTHNSNSRAAQARVLAVLAFDDTTIQFSRPVTNKAVTGGAAQTVENEPRGIGGLVGTAVNSTLTGLTVGSDVTVAGVLVDNGQKADTTNLTEGAERQRYANVKNGSINRAVGVGGVVGVFSAQNGAANLTAQNGALVYGSAFTGGVAGNLYSTNDMTLTGLVNNGLIVAGQNYGGAAAGGSKVLGQFFGGIAGHARKVSLNTCQSTTPTSLRDATLEQIIIAGYNTDGSLNETSPLRGDFVGGLLGFGENVNMTQCTTGSGYVLGNKFVGGMVGGLEGGTVWDNAGTNTAHVFGNRYVGGIVSVNGQNSQISNMTNSGMVAGFGKNAAYVGGIAGYNLGAVQSCSNTSASDTATNQNRVELLDRLSKNQWYASFVGGIVGYNAGSVAWNGAETVNVFLHGGSFVGGVVGYNDSTAALWAGSLITVTGRIAGQGNAVGGVAGMNCAASLPAATVRTEAIAGRYYVGGIVGANVPVGGFSADTLQTAGTGSITASGAAGGIIGYNRVIASQPALAENDDKAAHAASMLPTLDAATGSITPAAAAQTAAAPMTLTGAKNTLNLYADIYVGGIIGYNDPDTALTLQNAQNGAQNSVTYGIVRPADKRLTVQQTINGETVQGSMAGGIIGYAGKNTIITGSTNYAGVAHAVLAGGIAGQNDGTVQNCTQAADLGTEQDDYRYLGGITGVNNGTVQGSAPAQGKTVRGGCYVGGVAGVNNERIVVAASAALTVRGMEKVGGVAGVNYGTITAANATGAAIQVQVTASGSYAGGLAGQNQSALQNITAAGTVNGGSYVGGAAGGNNGTITGVTNNTAVRASVGYAGGLAGQNGGTLTNCTANGSVYAANSYAGGLAGENTGTVTGGTSAAQVTCENGAAAGVAAVNRGTVHGTTVQGSTVNSGADQLGGVAAWNESNAEIENVTVSGVALSGRAATVGGLTGTNAGTVRSSTVEQGALNLSGLTAAADTITLGGAIGENNGTAQALTVAMDVTANLEKYRTLGGVVGQNNGTLDKCVYAGRIDGSSGTSLTGAAHVGDAVGGLAGQNNGTVKDSYVSKISLYVLGVSNVSSSQTAAVKLQNASHVGGLVGRNTEKGTISGCYLATDGTTTTTGSMVAAKFGFVGGVAGSNAGSITQSGGAGTQKAVKQIAEWLSADTQQATQAATDEEGSSAATNNRYDGVNQLVTALTTNTDPFGKLRGVDTVSSDSGYKNVYEDAGLAKNQLLVALRGGTTYADFATGYLGGITGFNTDTGSITQSATGQWFVYCDNGNPTDAAIGGMIGQNESDKDLTDLLNCAAVRRYIRGAWHYNKENDDDENKENDFYVLSEHKANGGAAEERNNYVGGVIGVQQNRDGDRWSLTNIVNYGTVFNSRSNNAGGVVAYWADNGGTLQSCFNFGTLKTNMNFGTGSGTIGGIVAVFDKPVAGGTTNIISCQNHGDILWANENTKKTANDIGGILGKIEMKNPADYLIVNIVDCVNGKVKMQANSQCVGIMGWLGPYKTSAIQNAWVNIDRCRNYCTDATATGSDKMVIGIVGNRGANGATTAATTITNCFALYNRKDSNSSENAIARNRGSENVQTDPNQPNYYMDKYSFAISDNGGNNSSALGLETLQQGSVMQKGYKTPKNGQDHKNSPPVYGYRLFAGKDLTTGQYFAADIYQTKIGNANNSTTYSMQDIYGGNSYIDATQTPNKILSQAGADQAEIEFSFGESGTTTPQDGLQADTSRPDIYDVTDEAIQSYYINVLDKKSGIDKLLTSITARLSDEMTDNGKEIYGRYTVDWNSVTGASYYKVAVKFLQKDGNYTELADLPAATVYTNRFTFDAPDSWAEQYDGYVVEITPCNSKVGTTTSSLTLNKNQPFKLAKTLPMPQLEVRLEEGSPAIVLTNAADYAKVKEDWQVVVKYVYVNDSKTYESEKMVFAKGENNWKQISDTTGYCDKTGFLRAYAKIRTADNEVSQSWMRSAQYNQQTYIPQNFSGLGKLTLSAAKQGTTIEDLTITATLQSGCTVANPKYRVMIQGKCTDSTSPAYDKYVTLAARELTVPNSQTSVIFSNLPSDTLTAFTGLRMVAVPVSSGMGDTNTRWELAESDRDTEIVRNEDGTLGYYRITSWPNENGSPACSAMINSSIQVLPAPTLGEKATKELKNNELIYSFTWSEVSGANGYHYKLYGITEAGAEEEIVLPEGSYKLDTNGTSCILNIYVDKLQYGSTSWHYNSVKLYVTSVPAGTDSNVVGATADRVYTDIYTRLPQPGTPDSAQPTDTANADKLQYNISWAGIQAQELDHYELVVQKNENGKWVEAERLPTPDTAASLTVDLEQYQGMELQFYVVAKAKTDDTVMVLDSPNSGTSHILTVASRVPAPTVTGAVFSDTQPSLDVYQNNLSLHMNVASTQAAQHYLTGYLFKDEADYTAAAKLAQNWQNAAPNSAEKANALQDLQTKLAELLADPQRAVSLVDSSAASIGVAGKTAASETGTDVSLALSGSFKMRPQYAGWYLLPAVRTMAQSSEAISSGWRYYTAEAAQAPRVPLIKLDTPLLTNEQFAYTGKAATYDGPAETSNFMGNMDLTVKRLAITWPAVDNYAENDTDTLLATRYEVTVTNRDNSTYTIRFTVAPTDVYQTDETGAYVLDENGDKILQTARGTIVSVEKTDASGTTFTLDSSFAGENGWDISAVQTEETDENGSPVTVCRSAPTELQGQVQSADQRLLYYRLSVVPTLQAYTDTTGEVCYRLILPDMVELLYGTSSDSNYLQNYTQSVTVTAYGEDTVTTKSETATQQIISTVG